MISDKPNKREIFHFRSTELDNEMDHYLRNNKVPENKINEYRKLRHMVQENPISADYRFNPFFTEILISKLSQGKSSVISLDLPSILSHLLKKIMLATFVTIIFFMLYFYFSHGSLFEMPVIKPEELNDFKFISSILNH